MNIGNIVLFNNEYHQVVGISVAPQVSDYLSVSPIYYTLNSCFEPLGVEVCKQLPILFNSLSEFKQSNPELFI